MNLRTGYTTGACAAAAAHGAACILAGIPVPMTIPIPLRPRGHVDIPIAASGLLDTGAFAQVIKDAGDDPDVTNGAVIRVELKGLPRDEVRFKAGSGVGICTRPGLSIPAGEPAINPVPRQMIEAEIRKVWSGGVEITVSIPGGEQLAANTFNGRLGIEGGLSILGTTGIVRPYCLAAARRTIDLAFEVAAAQGLHSIVMVPGNIGAAAAQKQFPAQSSQIIEVGNLWGYALDGLKHNSYRKLLVLGHPGKLVKLAREEWNTHSSASEPVAEYIAAESLDLLGIEMKQVNTAQGIFEALESADQKKLANHLSEKITRAIERYTSPSPDGTAIQISTALVLMDGSLMGGFGELVP